MSTRKYLTRYEVSAMLDAALKTSRPERNYCLIIMAFLHGFRASELLSLKLSDLDIRSRILNISRMKNGFSTIHPLIDTEVRAIKRWLRVRQMMVENNDDGEREGWLFISQSGRTLSRQQFYNIIARAGESAGLSIAAHPHMLRHACGYALADNGVDTRLIQDYLGHRNIRHTVRYTASSAARFDGIWRQKRQQKKRQIEPNC